MDEIITEVAEETPPPPLATVEDVENAATEVIEAVISTDEEEHNKWQALNYQMIRQAELTMQLSETMANLTALITTSTTAMTAAQAEAASNYQALLSLINQSLKAEAEPETQTPEPKDPPEPEDKPVTVPANPVAEVEEEKPKRESKAPPKKRWI